MWKWLKWKVQGSPVIEYAGFHCGICGGWVRKGFTIPTYQSVGARWDTVGMCIECSMNVSGEE